MTVGGEEPREGAADVAGTDDAKSHVVPRVHSTRVAAAVTGGVLTITGDTRTSTELVAGARCLRSPLVGCRAYGGWPQVTQLDLRLRNEHDATVRSGLTSSTLMGVIVGRRAVQVPGLVGEDLDAMIRMVAPAIQTHLVGEGS